MKFNYDKDEVILSSLRAATATIKDQKVELYSEDYCCDHRGAFGLAELTKADIIIVAKLLGVTGEDFKGGI